MQRMCRLRPVYLGAGESVALLRVGKSLVPEKSAVLLPPPLRYSGRQSWVVETREIVKWSRRSKFFAHEEHGQVGCAQQYHRCKLLLLETDQRREPSSGVRIGDLIVV